MFNFCKLLRSIDALKLILPVWIFSCDPWGICINSVEIFVGNWDIWQNYFRIAFIELHFISLHNKFQKNFVFLENLTILFEMIFDCGN